MRKLNARQLAREKSLFRYSSALERADFATVEAVLHEAERDPELAQMITEINMVYENETLRLSPSLNHSSNHREKELLMTTIVLPQRKQPSLQRWLPVTLAAACVSVLFIGALLMRPIRPNGNALTGMQASNTATPTAAASPTIVPTSTPFSADSSMATIIPTVVPPENALVTAIDCNTFKIITEDVVVYGQPADQTLVLGRLPAGMLAQTLAEVSAAGNDSRASKMDWIFIKAAVGGDSVQGWIPLDKTQPACQSGVVNLTTGNVPQQIDAVPATMIPPSDITLAPAGSTVPVQIGGVSLPNSACYLTNQTANTVSIYAAPLTLNSNAAVVGELVSQANAIVLYQNYDPQSAPTGAVWYLIMTNAPSAQQVTGWVSANSVTTSAGTPCTVDVTGSGSSVTVTAGQVGSINSVPVPAQAAGETCHISNQTDSAATLFAAPLTNDSNAAVVGEFPAGSVASVILSSYDQQSAPIGALWYLIKVDSDKPVIGWVSANSIGTSNACGLADSAGVVVPTLVPQAAAGGVSSMGSTQAVAASPGICHVVNGQTESIPVFSGPSRDGSEATYVNNLPPNTPATVLYQQRNKQTGEVWYLVLAVMDQEKQLSGWVVADSVKVIDSCPDVP